MLTGTACEHEASAKESVCCSVPWWAETSMQSGIKFRAHTLLNFRVRRVCYTIIKVCMNH